MAVNVVDVKIRLYMHTCNGCGVTPEQSRRFVALKTEESLRAWLRPGEGHSVQSVEIEAHANPEVGSVSRWHAGRRRDG